MSFDDYNWYVLKVSAGREHSIAKNIESCMQKNDIIRNDIKEIYLPLHVVTDFKNNVKRSKIKSILSGYVLINMKITDSAIEFLKTIPGVRGFILSSNGNPAPLSKSDFEKISSSAKEKIEKFDKEARYEIGQTVKITDGPFASFVGEVEHVDYSKQRLRVAVAIFGQSTPVDLELSQVSVVDSDNWISDNWILVGLIMSKKKKKKIVANLKFNIKAGLASAAPPVGPVLGQKGVNIMDFCKTFNGMTQSYDKSYLMRALVAVYEDKTYTCEIRLPSVSWFIKHFLSIEKGSSKPGTNVVKKIKISDLNEIAKIKMNDMGVFSHEAARSMVVGTAKSMGIEVIDILEG